MKSNRFLLVGLLAIGVALPAAVTRASQTYTVYGTGNLSCGKWLSQKAESRTIALGNLGWVLGFVSGVASTGRKMTTTDLQGIDLWMDQYCLKNPLDLVAKASAQLIVSLDAK